MEKFKYLLPEESKGVMVRNVKKLKVLYSKELPIKPRTQDKEEISSKRQIPGSIAFVPPVAGMLIAGEVIKEIIYKDF